jgi:uncharacterized protein YodC (DUF2158 family)
MFREIFRKWFKVGDKVRLRTGQKAVISDKGNLLLAKKQISTFVLKFENGSPSMTVTPEDIERAALLASPRTRWT